MERVGSRYAAFGVLVAGLVGAALVALPAVAVAQRAARTRATATVVRPPSAPAVIAEMLQSVIRSVEYDPHGRAARKHEPDPRGSPAVVTTEHLAPGETRRRPPSAVLGGLAAARPRLRITVAYTAN